MTRPRRNSKGGTSAQGPTDSQGQATGGENPATASQVNELTKKINDVCTKLDAIQNTVTGMSNEISQLTTKLNGTTEKADKALNIAVEVQDKMEIVEQCLECFSLELEKSKHENKLLKDHIVRVEAQSRRDNLIFHGIKENDGENCFDLVYDILETKMEFPGAKDNFKITRCHRLGAKKPNMNRPIIFKLHYFPDRVAIWKNRSKLKNTGIYINEDFPDEINKRRQVLDPIRRQAVHEGKDAFLLVDRLILDGTSYSVDNLNTLPPSLRPQEVFTRRTPTHTGFFSRNSPLSNFYPCRFKDKDGIVFSSNEQYYQYHKALNCGDHIAAKSILLSDDPAQCKRLGDGVRIHDKKNWHDQSVKIMYEGCHLKFDQNRELWEFLLSTKNTVLVETNPRDTFWGIGLKLNDENMCKPEQWKGKNMLGKTLRRVRDALQVVDPDSHN